MTEAWLTGPVEGVNPVLMPAAHSFLQVRDEMPHLLAGLTLEQIWQEAGASASIGYHAIHLAGATDRLLTYARDEQLSVDQIEAMKGEKGLVGLDAVAIVARVQSAMNAAIDQVRRTPAETVLAPRAVGRQRLPSTVIGLIFHAAEHATRHAGQVSTLRKIVRS